MEPVRIVARESAQGVAALPTDQEIALLIQVCPQSLKWLGFSDGRGVSIVVRWWNSYLAVITLPADAAHSSGKASPAYKFDMTHADDAQL
ncbi:hypothetical protein APSETT445_008325 [Aspergillus pseudonomiae]